jgi:hypothetical protein
LITGDGKSPDKIYLNDYIAQHIYHYMDKEQNWESNDSGEKKMRHNRMIEYMERLLMKESRSRFPFEKNKEDSIAG